MRAFEQIQAKVHYLRYQPTSQENVLKLEQEKMAAVITDNRKHYIKQH